MRGLGHGPLGKPRLDLALARLHLSAAAGDDLGLLAHPRADLVVVDVDHTCARMFGRERLQRHEFLCFCVSAAMWVTCVHMCLHVCVGVREAEAAENSAAAGSRRGAALRAPRLVPWPLDVGDGAL